MDMNVRHAWTSNEGRPAKVRVSVRQATRSAAMPGAIMPMSSLPRFLALPCVPTRRASLAESPATPNRSGLKCRMETAHQLNRN